MAATPPFLSPDICTELNTLAEQPDNLSASLLFRATYRAQLHDWNQVIALLNSLPRHTANDIGFTLLSEALLETGHTEEAATLLRDDHLFALANDRRYQLLARAETTLGHPDAAVQANERAERFGPIPD